MNPLFFGDSRRPLYGVYHPPRQRGAKERGVVLCYPFGQEYMRSHRAFRQLAVLLAKAGYAVLRFDYFGTGDSAGESEDGSVEQWVTDVHTAVQELRDTSGALRVTLVGLRLGAALAALAAVDREDVDLVVLWDPVTDGSDYLAELLAGRAGEPTVSAPAGINGFPLTARLRAEIDALDLHLLRPRDVGRTALVVSSEREPYLRLRDAMLGGGRTIDFRCVPSMANWGEVDSFGSALLPQEIIQSIVGVVTEERA